MNICIGSGFYVKAWVLTDFEDITAFSNLQKFASSFDQYGENIDDSENIIDDREKHRKNCECCPGHYLIVR